VQTVLRLVLAAHLAIFGCDPSGSLRIHDVNEQESPFHHKTIEADPVPHRNKMDLTSMCETESCPKPQCMLPVGHDRELGGGIIGDEHQGTGDVLKGIARVILADNDFSRHAIFHEPLFHQDAQGNRLSFQWKVDPTHHDDGVVVASPPKLKAADKTPFGDRASQLVFRRYFAAWDEQVTHDLLLSSHKM
jgi:hypothetical protein